MSYSDNNFPIYRMLSDYAGEPHSSFHTPGHKGRIFRAGFFDIYKYDATELSVTDELYSPRGCISEAENNATELFGSFHTFFSAGGASQCVKTALSEFAGKKVLFDRNVHFSAASAIAFYGIDAVFVCGKFDSEKMLPIPPAADDFREVLESEPDVRAIFLTSPNYFGVSSDCHGIRSLCDEYGITFIDDNSHGSHYEFCPSMKRSAFDAHHAHVVIDSAHKTLPVMTGGALLHYNKEISVPSVRRRMMAAGSTSPSFPILASLDYGLWLCSSEGDDTYAQCCSEINCLRNELKAKGFIVSEGGNIDPLRVSVYFGEDCDSVCAALETANIYPEMTMNGYIVFIFTPYNKKTDIELLKNVLFTFRPVESVEKSFSNFKTPIKKCSIRDAFFSEKETVSPISSVGRISAEMISFHKPPCVPLCLPGEEISAEVAELLSLLEYGDVEVLA